MAQHQHQDAMEAEVARLLHEIPTASDNATQINLFQRVQEIVFHRDASGDDRRLLHVSIPLLSSLYHVQNAPLTAALFQFLSQANRISRPPNAWMTPLYELSNAVLMLSFSSEKNVLQAIQVAMTHLHSAFLSICDRSFGNGDIASQQALWENVMQSLEQAVDSVTSSPLPSANRNVLVWLRAWKYLERAVLLLSVARDCTVYRDPARSNIQPDAVTIDRLTEEDGQALNKSKLEAFGVFVVQRLCERLVVSGATVPLGRRELCVAINSLSLVAALRPQHMPQILPCLVTCQSQVFAAFPDRAVQETIGANLVKLLSHPSAQTHADEVTECLIGLNASERAFRAISKSKEPRRKYVSAPSEASLRKARFNKRTAQEITEKVENDGSKRVRTYAPQMASTQSLGNHEKLTHERIVNLPSTEVVNLVLDTFSNELPTPAPANLKLELTPSELKARMTQLLGLLATPSSALAIETSARRHRDPRRRRDPREQQQPLPSLVPIFDDTTTIEEVSDWISKNASSITEPLVSVSEENVVQVFLKPVTPVWCREMAMAAVYRILENEYGVSIRGDEQLREVLLCRLASSPWLLFTDERNQEVDPTSSDASLPTVYRTILDFVLEDFGARASVAKTLLFHEYIRFTKSSTDDNQTAKNVLYRRCVQYVLRGLLQKMDVTSSSDKKLFVALIASLPMVSVEVLEVIHSQLFQNLMGGTVLGITVLRDLIKERKTCQVAALRLLLRYTCDADESCRNSSIRCVANQLYAIESLREEIEAFAIQLVESLRANSGEKDVVMKTADDEVLSKQEDDEKTMPIQWRDTMIKIQANQEQAEQELRQFAATVQHECALEKPLENEAETLRRLELLLALCAKKPSFLKHFVAAYGHASESARQVMFHAIEKLIKHLKQRGNVDVIAQLHGFEVNALGFVCHVIQILCARTRPSEDLVQQTLALYEAHASIPDAISVLIPVLPGISRDVLFPLLPSLLSLPVTRLSVALTRLLDAMPPQLVSPSEFLVALHHVDLKTDPSMQKKVIQAINLCVEHRHVFPGEVLLHVCRKLVDHDPIPKLTLRTLILSITTYPAIQTDAVQLLEKLVDRHVWAMEDALWKGFVKCAALVQPASFPLLLQRLPVQQLQLVLEDQPDLRPLLKEYVNQHAIKTEETTDTLEITPEIRQLLD